MDNSLEFKGGASEAKGILLEKQGTLLGFQGIIRLSLKSPQTPWKTRHRFYRVLPMNVLPVNTENHNLHVTEGDSGIKPNVTLRDDGIRWEVQSRA